MSSHLLVFVPFFFSDQILSCTMVSTLSGPIPPHPYYDKSDVRTYLNLPAPRVRPEAQDIAHHGEQGTIGGVMLHIEGQRCPSAASKHSMYKYGFITFGCKL